MLKVHVAERLAIAAGLVPPDRPARRFVSLGFIATVLAAVVGLVALYVSVREMTQPGSIPGPDVDPVRTLSRIAPSSGGARLMSIEDMRRLADQD